MKRRLRLLVPALVVVIAIVAYALTRRPAATVMTGIVTTDTVIVSSEIQGRLEKLLVNPGDTVKRGDLLAEIQPQESDANLSYYDHSMHQAEADLRYQEAETDEEIRQAEANLAAAKAQVTQADADEENAALAFRRENTLFDKGTDSQEAFDQARTGYDSAKAHTEALRQQARSAESALALARSQQDQVAVRRAALAASTAQREKAAVQLGYTEIHAPIGGTIDVRAALQGEVVNPGQAIVTIVDPDDLWVRADVEESAIDRIHLGDRLTVRLPSGATREGTVFYRGVDASYATQRDVSRTKRDIKTFEIRLRCDNRDRSLAVGMTAYVILPPLRTMGDIEVENLTKRFGTFCAVDGLSFAVNHGEVFGLLGPNGAGKSTLIRMLVTLVPPTSGTARVNGHDIVSAAGDVRRSIGVIPQALTSDLDLSARENMSIFAKLYGIPAEKRRRVIRELLEAVDLTEWADEPLKKFSGGMRRRLEIARGLVHEPKIFFLDEPTTGLDPVSRVAVWEMLSRLRRERDLTILVTTHYMDEADKLCDRIAIVDHGKIVALDSPLKLKASIPGRNILDVSFSSVPAGWAETLRSLPDAAEVKVDDNIFRISSHNGPRTTVELIDAAKRAGISIASLSVQSTTLDDVFVHFTGHELRDALQAQADPTRRLMPDRR